MQGELKELATLKKLQDMLTELTTYFSESLAKTQVESLVGSSGSRHKTEEMLLVSATFNSSNLED